MKKKAILILAIAILASTASAATGKPVS